MRRLHSCFEPPGDSRKSLNLCAGVLQLVAQKEVAAEQGQHARGLEGTLRQLEERCAELKQASAGHEERGREAAAETAKAARAVEKLTVCSRALAASNFTLTWTMHHATKQPS